MLQHKISICLNYQKFWIKRKNVEEPQIEERTPNATKILKLREIVTKAIEPLRADKKIGSSLEVAVYIKGGEQELLSRYEKELANIFITSQAELTQNAPENVLNEYTEDNYTIYVTKAHGKKCERCWKYRDLVNVEGKGAICQDCLDAINGK